MANFANPTVGSNYTDFPGEIRASVDAALQQLSVGTHTNIPTGAIKFDISANRWKKFNGSAFVDLTSSYDLNAVVSVNELQLENNERIKIGDSQQLQIYTNGIHSYIQETGSGALQIRGANIIFDNADGTERYIDCNLNGSVELYNDNLKRLETDGNGIQVTSRVGIGGAASVELDVFGTGQIGTSSTGDAELIIGRSGSGNRNAFIDIIGDNTYSDYGLRLLRGNTGANSSSELRHRGTGSFNFINNEAAEFRFYTSANQKAVITSNGRLGIGTTSPNVEFVIRGSTPQITLEPTADTQNCRYQFATTDGSVQSSIQGGGSLGTSIRIFQSSTQALTIQTNNRIGIGTSSPEAKLDVVDSSSLGIISRSSTTQSTDTNKALKVRNNSATTTFHVSYKGMGYFATRLGIGTVNPDSSLHILGDQPVLRLESNNSLDTSAGTEPISSIEFEGTKGSNLNVCARIRVRQDGTWSTTDDFFSPTAIEFFTQDQSGTQVTTPRVTINSLGNMGVGVTPSSTRFQVKGVSGTNPTCLIEHSDADVEGEFLRIGRTDVSGIRFHSLKAKHGGASTSNYIIARIHNGSTTTAQSEVIRIRGDERVGLRTSNPSSLLHLIGIQTITAGAFANNISTGNRDFTASIDIQSTSMRGGVVVRNMNNFRSTTTSASFMHYDPYDTTATSLAFRVSRGATLADTFTVRSDGRTFIGERLGIGTSSPERSLHVVGSDCRIKLSDSDVTADFEIQNSSGNGVLLTNAATPIIFYNNNSESARIDATGRFMINRTSADFHLDVSGAARLSGYIYLSNAQRVVWGTSDSAFIQGDDASYLLFAVNNEVFRINTSALRIGQTSTDFPGSNATVGASITKTGRIHSSTADQQTGFTANANTSSLQKHFCSFRRNGTQIASIKQETGGVSYNTTSDRRLKENIVDIKDALLTLLKLKPKEYNWNSDKNKVSEHGFIAQDLLEDKLCEYAVAYSEEEDNYGMDYGRLTAITIAAIQELAGKVSDLEAKLG